jgi:hypothetical protein
MSTRAWVRSQDWLLWGAVGFALVGTAHAEYTLAVATGVNQWVALAVPGALDLYVVRAIRSGRDVFLAVLAMVAANVAAHLVVAGVLAVDWRLISAVGALPPLILWRVYALRRTRTRKELLWDVPVDGVPDTDTGADTVDAWRSRDCMDPQVCMESDKCPECDPAVTAPAAYTWDQDYLPAGWVAEYKADTPSADPVSADPSDQVEGVSATDTVLQIPLPPGYEPDTVVLNGGTPLKETDTPYLGSLKAYLDTVEEMGTQVTLRGCMAFCNVGQDRARRLLGHAGYPREAQ